MDNTNNIKSRNEIEQKYKWKIEDLYKSDNIWQEEYDNIIKQIPQINKFKNNLKPDNLYECFKLSDNIGNKVEKLYVYANLRANEDSTNTFYQALSDKADSMIVKFQSAVSFIEPEILELDEKELLKFLNNDSNLIQYKHYIENILRNKEHILSTEKEQILAQIYEIEQAPENIYSMINNADMTFPDAEDSKGNKLKLTHGKYISYLESQDRVLRKSAFDNYYKQYYNLKNTISATYNSSVKKDVFNAHIRNFKSSVEASLFGTNIPVKVYKNLIDTVNKNLNLMHRYIKLRKKCLKLDNIHMYDLYTPIVEKADTKKNFEDAKETILKALEPLGKNYIDNLKQGLEGGWIDIYENIGKRSGAYAWGSYGCHPYVSLNYDNTINSMFTLIHEMGHAMHSHYTWSTQPYIYGDYTIFVAEVASTVNEALLMEYLLNTTTDVTQKKYLLNYFMEQFRGTLFRQTMFAEFELFTHEQAEKGEPLTFDSLCSEYRKLNEKYFGTNIVIDEQINWEWSRIPHFYTPFYVYQYATGYSAAIALSQKILFENGSDNYIKFLKGGSSDYSINLLKTAGVDMSSSVPVENAMNVFENIIKQMEELTD